MEQPFYIGQRVATVWKSRFWAKGEVFTVIDMKQKVCCDMKWLVHIEVAGNPTHCHSCHQSHHGVWYHQDCFVPAVEQSQEVKQEFKEVTYTEIKKEINVPQSVN